MDKRVILSIIFAITIEFVTSHAILISPVARASAWRLDANLAIQYPNPIESFSVIF